METVSWQDSFHTGIEEIDAQHRELVEYLNVLHQVSLDRDRRALAEVVAGMMEYTLSHFAFEEALMQEAKYPCCTAHQKIHENFVKRVEGLSVRFQHGEDIIEEMYTLLRRWLIHHIQRDDAAYVRVVKAHLQLMPPGTGGPESSPERQSGWVGRMVRRFSAILAG